MLKDLSRRHSRQVGAPRRRSQRQCQPYQVMRRIADHRLVEVADLYRNTPFGIGQRTKVADMAIAADPDRWTFRDFPAAALQPLVELDGAAPDIGMRRTCHLQITGPNERFGALFRGRHGRSSPSIADKLQCLVLLGSVMMCSISRHNTLPPNAVHNIKCY